ncbi:MAG: hypothetical protein DCE90_09630 [Pseudanabaena sp.]|nr:MAG: hypothetical protein DCE90_09630 [Pseudanabaena sp.]
MSNAVFKFSTALISSVFIAIAPSQAQIVGDQTLPVNTVITNVGKTFTITGGTELNGNQFHSFQQFSLPTGNTAYFNNRVETLNIIGRVTGKSISDIDGLIKANGQANLWLINPNGIVFGENARLELGGSFTASTANSIKFADGQEFSATNPQSPTLLTINTPVGLQYGKEQQAQITNSGNLRTNRDLTLSGGAIASTGSLAATQGNLRVQSISGDVEVREAIAKTATFTAARNLVLKDSQIATAGDLTLQAQDTLTVRDSIERPFIADAGGRLTVQGDRLIDIFALNSADSGFYAGSDLTLRSNNTAIGDAHYYSGGNFKIEQLDGKIGNLDSPIDPIIRSLGDVTFGVYTGRSLHIIAGGKVTVDSVLITNIETADTATVNRSINPTSNPDLAEVPLSDGSRSITINGRTQPTLDIRAGVRADKIATTGVTGTTSTNRVSCSQLTANCFSNLSGTFVARPSTDFAATGNSIEIGNVAISAPSNAPSGLVLLTNNYEPDLSREAEDITVTGVGLFSRQPDFLGIRAGIDILGFSGDGGALYIDSRRDVNINGNQSIITSSIAPNSNGGDITVIANRAINLGDNLQIRADGTNLGGNINLVSNGAIAARGLQLSSASNSPTSTGASGNINIKGSSLNLVNSDTFTSQVVTSTAGAANAGNITLNIINGDVKLEGAIDNAFTGVLSAVLPNASGNSGNITIQSRDLSILNGARVSANTQGTGNAGKITISSDSVNISGARSALLSQIANSANAMGNPIEIQTRTLAIADGGQIGTQLLGFGEGGNLNITATEKVEIDNGIVSSLISGGEGLGGSITFTTPNFLIQNQSRITSDVNGVGTAGNISLNISDNARFDRSLISASIGLDGKGTAGNINVTANDLLIANGSQVNSGVNGQGNGGAINVTTQNLAINGTGTFGGTDTFSGIFGSVNSNAIGNGGVIKVNSQSVALSNLGRISASTAGQGDAGKIDITANSLDISSGAKLRSVTLGSGKAGDINLFLSDRLSLTGEGSDIVAESDLNSTGIGGNIFIDPAIVRIIDKAKVSVSSLGTGDGGNILLIAGLLFLDRGAITAETANGLGGNINLQVQDVLRLRNGSLISATAGNNGDGGNIDLGANFILTFANENNDIFANAFRGRGGNINITTQGIFGLESRDRPSPFSDITASSEFGLNGTVQINTPGVDPSKGLSELPAEVTDASRLLSQQCISDAIDNKFFITGRGGLPPSPTDTYQSAQILENIGSVKTSTQGSSYQSQQSSATNIESGGAIVEAQSWIIDKSGQISLVSASSQPLSNLFLINNSKCN